MLSLTDSLLSRSGWSLSSVVVSSLVTDTALSSSGFLSTSSRGLPLLEEGAVLAASAESYVVIEAMVVESMEGLVAESVEGCYNVVRVRIVIPGFVVAAGVPWPAEVGLPGGVSPGVASLVALDLAAVGVVAALVVELLREA